MAKNSPSLKSVWKQSSRTLAQKGLFLVVGSLVFEFAFVLLLTLAVQDAERQIEKERHAREAISHLDRISIATQNATIGLLTQLELHDNPGSARFHSTYTAPIEEIPRELAALKQTVSSDDAQQSAIANLENLCRSGIQQMEKCRLLYNIPNSEYQQLAYKLELHKLGKRITSQLEVLVDEYRHMAEAGLAQQKDARNQVKMYLYLGALLQIVVAFFLGRFFIASITNRLGILKDNSVRLAIGKPLHEKIRGNDEITDLDNVFHQMAETLAEAVRKERSILDNASDLICSVDKEQKFTAVNRASLSVLGYESEELLGKRVMDLVIDDDKERTYATMSDLIKQQSSGHLENRLRKKDGKPADLLWSLQWSHEDEALTCVIHDISERRELERLKQDFVAMVSHDLRTPLTAIRGTLALLEEGAVDTTSKSGQERVVTAGKSVERLIKLVNDLLDLEKLEAGKMEVRLVVCSLKPLVEHVVESVQYIASQSKINIEVSGVDGIEVLADQDRLTQVLVNLLGNGIQYSPEKGKITVAVSREGESMCRIGITDQGPGIDQAAQERLFSRFSQLESPDGKKRLGTGLGLAISKAIVEGHHGSIGVESQPGQGSTFWLTLMLAP